MAGIGEMRDPWLLIKLEEMTADNVYSCTWSGRLAAEDGPNFIRKGS